MPIKWYRTVAQYLFQSFLNYQAIFFYVVSFKILFHFLLFLVLFFFVHLSDSVFASFMSEEEAMSFVLVGD